MRRGTHDFSCSTSTSPARTGASRAGGTTALPDRDRPSVVDRLEAGLTGFDDDEARDVGRVAAGHEPARRRDGAGRPGPTSGRSCAQGPAHATTVAVPSGPPTSRAGSADASPRPETVTGDPSRSSSATGSRGSKTRAGTGPGTAPGQVGCSGPRSSPRGSPHGTQRTRSAGVRPPHGTTATTASGPWAAWSRVITRSARSPAAASPPQKPSCRPVAGMSWSGRSRTTVSPAVASSSAWSGRSAIRRAASARG